MRAFDSIGHLLFRMRIRTKEKESFKYKSKTSKKNSDFVVAPVNKIKI